MQRFSVNAVHSKSVLKDMRKFGGVAQLGEHLPCKQGVRSSILLISTKAFFTKPKIVPACGAQKAKHNLAIKL